MIGSAEMHSRLYFLNLPKSQTHNDGESQSNSCFHSIIKTNNDSDVMLWHYRLGHPNFLYLKRMFPSLFINKILNCSNMRYVSFLNRLGLPIQNNHINHLNHLQ